MKNLLHLTAALFAAATFAACTDNRESDDMPVAGRQIELTAIAVNDATRTHLADPDQPLSPVLWDAGDAVELIEVGGTAANTCTSSGCTLSDDASRAVFSFSLPARTAQSFTYRAVYPASAFVGIVGTSELSLVLPSEQHPAAASYDPAAALMLATDPETYYAQPEGSSRSLTLRFAHLAAYAQMKLTGLPTDKGDIVGAGFESGTTPVAGAVSYDCTSADDIAPDLKSIKLIYDKPVAAASSFDAWFAAAPCTFAADDIFTVTVEFASGTTIKRTVTIPQSRNLEFKRGAISTFSVDMSAATAENPITIPEILDGISSAAEAIDADKDRVLYAVVSVDAANGNYTNRNIMIQTPDSTSPDNGMILFGPTSANYRFGDLLRITLPRNTAKRVNYNNNGQLEITGVTDSNIKVLGNREIKPVEIEASQMIRYHGMLVTLKDVSSPAEGGTWCTNYDGKHYFTAADGSSFMVFVKKNAAAFANKTFFGARGPITGYVSIFSNSPQLCPNTIEDVAAFAEEPKPEPADYIYYENFDGNMSYPSGTWADSNTTWRHPQGTGAAEVSYLSRSVQIRNSTPQSSGYDGASGNYYAHFFGTAGYFISAENIALESGQVNLRLTFGCNFTSDGVTITVSSPDRSAEIAYTGTTSNGAWGQGYAEFTLAKPVEKLSIKFANNSTNIQKLDDIKLEAISTPSSQVIDLSPVAYNYKWAEIPTVNVSDSDRKQITHWTTTVVSKKRVRNFTSYYDTRRHCPMWVAHTLHECYREGSGRSSTSSWRPDPNLTNGEQSIIYAWSSDWAGYEYWTNNVLMSLGRSDTWTRGHMLMSNYRPGAEEEINLQTFYSTNIAPQGFDAFDALWIQAESNALKYQCADTLYYVSGCYFANENWKEYDASNWGSLSPESKECVVPTHFYKVLLRTKAGNTGKPVQECSADELQAVGIWFEHAEKDPVEGATTDETKWPLTSAHLCSVAEIEARTGHEFTFFPEVPAAVKQSFSLSDWSELVSQ